MEAIMKEELRDYARGFRDGLRASIRKENSLNRDYALKHRDKDNLRSDKVKQNKYREMGFFTKLFIGYSVFLTICFFYLVHKLS